jgi:hypothetical protein
MTDAEPADAVNLAVMTSSGHFQRCPNPFCNAAMAPMNRGRWPGLSGASALIPASTIITH